MSVRSSCCPWCLSLGLCMCYRRLCCHCSVWLDSRLSHVMAGVCFRSAAQKLLEVSVYKQGDVWDHIWIHGQSADSSGVLYCLWVQLCTVSSLLCPLSQYPLFQSFSYRLIFPPPLQLSLVSAATQGQSPLTGKICLKYQVNETCSILF